MFSKKAEMKLIENIIIIVVLSGIIIFFAFYLTNLNNLSIDDKEIRSQIITKQLVRNCFSEDYGTIEKDKFNQEGLDECFKGIDENSLFRIGINKEEKLYINNKKDLFAQRGQFCSLSQESSQYCKQVVYPIIFVDSAKKAQNKFLTIDLIIA